jgi:hypothetical protein
MNTFYLQEAEGQWIVSSTETQTRVTCQDIEKYLMTLNAVVKTLAAKPKKTRKKNV